MDIDPRHLKIIFDILKKYEYEFFVFGSRALSKAKKFSDLDLFYKEEIPNNILIKLEEEFEESDLPYKVDIRLPA